MSILSIQSPSVSDLASAVGDIRKSARHTLLLFDRGLKDLQDSFLQSYILDQTSRGDLVVSIRGERTQSESDLFSELRLTVPFAESMGSNFNAMEDVFSYQALSQNRLKRTHWLWSNAHVLYQANRKAFDLTFEVLADCARQASKGFAPAGGETIPPRANWSPQVVLVLVTGIWEIMKDVASDPNSIVNRLPTRWKSFFPDLSTNFVTLRVVGVGRDRTDDGSVG